MAIPELTGQFCITYGSSPFEVCPWKKKEIETLETSIYKLT